MLTLFRWKQTISDPVAYRTFTSTASGISNAQFTTHTIPSFIAGSGATQSAVVILKGSQSSAFLSGNNGNANAAPTLTLYAMPVFDGSRAAGLVSRMTLSGGAGRVTFASPYAATETSSAPAFKLSRTPGVLKGAFLSGNPNSAPVVNFNSRKTT